MAKRKKRKVKVFRLLLIAMFLLLIIFGLTFVLMKIINSNNSYIEFNADDYTYNELDYSLCQELPLDLNSKDYELICLNDFKVLFAKNNTKKIYPASLTKVLTMSTVLDNCQDLNDTSYISSEQYENLIEENASLAGIEVDTDYSIEDLLYALVLPSGADGAEALNNYVLNKTGNNLPYLMNNKCQELGLHNSNFTNTTGLHDDNLYTTLDDYSRIVIDALNNAEGKLILKTIETKIDGDLELTSTLYTLSKRYDGIQVYGGKTGYTPEAGMNIMVLYKANNRSYLLILAEASGSPYTDGLKHVDDVNAIFNYLYHNVGLSE